MVTIEEMTQGEIKALLLRCGFGHPGCSRADELERAMQLITDNNPTLTPAINRTETDAWGRSNSVAIYRIRPSIVDGRKTA
jgi:hypothetical protein